MFRLIPCAVLAPARGQPAGTLTDPDETPVEEWVRDRPCLAMIHPRGMHTEVSWRKRGFRFLPHC